MRQVPNGLFCAFEEVQQSAVGGDKERVPVVVAASRAVMPAPFMEHTMQLLGRAQTCSGHS